MEIDFFVNLYYTLITTYEIMMMNSCQLTKFSNLNGIRVIFNIQIDTLPRFKHRKSKYIRCLNKLTNQSINVRTCGQI